MGEFMAKYPNTRVITYDPVSAAALLAANEQSFGQRAIPSYHFDQADVIVSFNADFLGTWISPVEYARAYAKRRKITDKKMDNMSRHYQVESHMSLTGSNADNRILVKPSEQGAAICALYNEVAALTGAGSIGGPKVNDKAAASMKKVARELVNAKGKSLVVSASNNVAEQVIVNKINDLLGNINTTVDFGTLSYQRQGDERDMVRLIEEMKSGQVAIAIVWGANPAYELPNAVAFKEAFAKVNTRVSFSGVMDETTSLCTHAAPAHHSLESWGDVEPKEGHLSMIQPTIAPLFDTRQAELSLLMWADSPNLNLEDEQPYYQYLKSYWASDLFGRQNKYSTPTAFWDMSVHDGVFEMPASGRTVSFNGNVSSEGVSKPSGSAVEISCFETVNIGNGQYAHNPWLQEMPDPVNRSVWGNYLAIPVEWDGVNNINGWQNLTDGDHVDVTIGGKTLNCAVVRGFGQMPGTVSIALGQGREAGGCGVGYGVNVNPWLGMNGNLIQYYAGDVQVSDKPTSTDKNVPCVQHHHTMGVAVGKEEDGKPYFVDEHAIGYKGFAGALTDRSIIFQAHVNELPELGERMEKFHEEAGHLNQQTLYPDRSEFFGTGLHWGMYVDLNSCIGCGACQVACVSENNVPVVGKNEVARHHEMTWLRIDRYFYGDLENPKVVYQPMMCQHCETAPCENVCPVNATNHSMEGLNQMAYNRCIGTRYCANNCPYKVRRFNWLDYTTADLWPANEERVFHVSEDDKPFYADNLVRMVLNPDVTVRSRGVIEKCSFCVQRIQEGKLTAKKETRALADNDVRTACQTACPTGAITFGNLNNPDSEVNQKRNNAGAFAYQVLEEINTRPGVKYSAKIHNSNEELNS
ncbi:MAG: 4Fe-4S dicluster domain-containing protein [Lewinellaceae bacterium]|nr:4Fe-4S dicluster domain-containing protein [Lewinellaceae bacterium]